MNKDDSLRKHVLELLEGKSAHIDTEAGLEGFPLDKINEKVDGSPHTAWQLLEHLRIAQWDILDFSRNSDYKEMKWPDDYWPKTEGTAESWKASVHQVLGDLHAMRDMVADEKTDLFATIPWGDGQTTLREALLIVDHNAYHLGQIVLLRRIFENR